METMGTLREEEAKMRMLRMGVSSSTALTIHSDGERVSSGKQSARRKTNASVVVVVVVVVGISVIGGNV